MRQFLLSFVVQPNANQPRSAACNIMPRFLTRTITFEAPPTPRQVAAVEAQLAGAVLTRAEAQVLEVKLFAVSELSFPAAKPVEPDAVVVHSTERPQNGQGRHA